MNKISKVQSVGTGGVRIYLPKSVRGVLRLNIGDYVEFHIKDDDTVEIKKEEK